MYLINYSTGAIRWETDIKLNNFIHLLTTGVVVSIVDVDNKRALIRSKEDIGWAAIPELEKFSDEELSVLEGDPEERQA